MLHVHANSIPLSRFFADAAKHIVPRKVNIMNRCCTEMRMNETKNVQLSWSKEIVHSWWPLNVCVSTLVAVSCTAVCCCCCCWLVVWSFSSIYLPSPKIPQRRFMKWQSNFLAAYSTHHPIYQLSCSSSSSGRHRRRCSSIQTNNAFMTWKTFIFGPILFFFSFFLLHYLSTECFCVCLCVKEWDI